MRFETLKEITSKIRKAIKEIESNENFPKEEWDIVDNFCSALNSDIIHASDTLSVLPDSANPEYPYIQKVLMVLRCYSTILNSGCFVKVDRETWNQLKNLVETDYYIIDDQDTPTTMRLVFGSMSPSAYD